MLDTQTIDLDFKSGANTKTTDKNTLFTSFRELKNFRIDKVGAVVPRGGMNVISSTYSSSRTYNAFDLVTTGSQTAFLVDNKLLSVAPRANSSAEIAPAIRGAFSRLYGGNTFYNHLSCAASSTQVCFVWGQFTSNKMGILVINATTEEVLIQTEVDLPAYTFVQAVCVGNDFYLLYVDSGSDLAAYKIDASSITNPMVSVSWLNFPTGTSDMKFSAVGVNGKIYLHYCPDTSVTTRFQVVTISNGGLNFTSATFTGALTFATNPSYLSITAVTSVSTAVVACFAAVAGSQVRGTYFDAAGARVGTEQSASLSSSGTIKTWWAYEDTAATRPGIMGWQTLDSSGNIHAFHYSIATASNALTEKAADSKAFLTCGPVMIDGRPVAIADSYTEGTYGSQAAVCTKTSTNGLSTSLATLGVGANLGQFLYGVGRINQLSSAVSCAGKYYFPAPMISAMTGILAPDTTSTSLVYPTLQPKVQATLLVLDPDYQNVSIFDRTNNQSTYMGAQTRILESNDQIAGTWPEVTIVPSLDLSLISGGLTGVYSWTFAKLYRSPSGLEYRTYSPIYTATISSKKLQYILNASTLAGCSGVEVYRTEANGTIFYRSNFTLSSTVGTYTDDSTDAVLMGGRLAEINGNELAPEPIPSARLACYYNDDRIALVTADNTSEIWFNKRSPFPAGTSFSTGLKLTVAAVGGAITGIATMGSALYIFKRNSISSVYGEPAGLTGENSTLTEPKTLYNGVGCTDPRSLILTQIGLMFQSGKGFYLLTIDQKLQFIGAGPYDDRSITVTGSAVSQNLAEVIFSFSNGSTWVFNTDLGAWYEWTTASGVKAVAAADGEVYLAQTTGVLDYSPDTTSDSYNGSTTTDVVQDLTTGWIRLGGIADYQRVKRLVLQMDVNSACTATIDVYTDYSSTSVQTITVDTTTLTQQSPAELDIHLKVQKCEAISFRIRTNKYGVSLQGATLVIGVKQGRDKSHTAPNKY